MKKFLKIVTIFVFMELFLSQYTISLGISGKILDIGHSASISLLRSSNNRLLSQDSTGKWIVWDVIIANK